MSEVVKYAQRQRHAALLEKVRSGKALCASELKELEQFEEMAKKQAKNKDTPEKKGSSTPELNQNQIAFCYSFITDNNATRAYKEVYKCSEKAAESGSCRLLRNVKIQQKINELKTKAIKRSEITLDKVIDELGKIAFSNIRDCIDLEVDSLVFKSAKDIPEDAFACISEITQLKNGSLRVKFYDKARALESLKQYFVDNPGTGDDAKKIITMPLAIEII